MYVENYTFLDNTARKPTYSFNYCDDDQKDHECDVFSGSHNDKPLLVMIHGGYWRQKFTKDHLSPLAGALMDLEYTVLLPEYRRVSGCPDFTYDDIKVFILKIKELSEFKSRKMILIGHSVGGNISIIMSLFKNIKLDAMILLAPVTDMILTEELDLGEGAVKEFLKMPAKNRLDLDPISLPVENIPTFLIHGIEDTKVPVKTSRSYVEYAKKYNVIFDYLELEWTGHFELINPKCKEVFSHLVSKLKSCEKLI